MFQPENNAITIAVDDEHSIDDLVTLIAPHISSGQTIEGSGRFVYVVEWCCSEEVFQLVMSLSKYTGLAIDLNDYQAISARYFRTLLLHSCLTYWEGR